MNKSVDFLEGPRIHDWTVYAHACFLDQFEAMVQAVDQLSRKHPATYQKKAVAKRLEAVTKLAFDIIPKNPTLDEYRQGKTLGQNNKHWFRAKFYQQYRLFFRYHSGAKIIIFGWVNDDQTKRAYESKTDAYKVFKKMLEDGHPPNDWDELLSVAKQESQRLKELLDDT